MHVAVCVVGFRNADDIRACLAALDRGTYADLEVVICENGGPEGFAALSAMLAERPSGRPPARAVLAPGNLGYAGGVNVCMRETPAADAWWLLNPDTEPQPEALSHMVEVLESGAADAVGSTVCGGDGVVESRGGLWRPWLARAVSIDFGRPADQPATNLVPSYLSGASMLVGRRFLETVGPMREDYFLYAEEVEWCLRGAGAGMRLRVAPAARVVHHQGAATGSVADPRHRSRLAVYLDERNKLLLTRDFHLARLPVVAVAAVALSFLRFARRGAWRQWGYALDGWWAGLRDLRGPPPWLAR